MPDFNDSTVIAHSPDPAKAYEDAEKQGFNNPVIMFVPDPNVTYIY